MVLPRPPAADRTGNFFWELVNFSCFDRYSFLVCREMYHTGTDQSRL